LVDLRSSRPVDEDGLISEELFAEMKLNLERGEQTILFVNRRGFAAFMVCRDCGEALSCESCSVTYTWHRKRQRLTCHWCGHEVKLPPTCPSCDSEGLQDVGFGTERLENIVRQLLPEARVARMDRDTTRGKALPRLLRAFRAREIDILVGTQMVAKGHDFPGVTLVGVMLAELGLRLPDFRASERTFQLLTQIAGRAGRADKPGRVLVQSYVPEHYALERARHHDARGFLEAERQLREALDYPPFGHLALFRVSSPERQHAEVEAERLSRRIQAHDAGQAIRLQGPMPAPVERARERWRYQLLCRCRSRSVLGGILKRVQAELADTPPPASVHITLDVDPMTFM
jgi:primosomal protein N' (replication factor Y)